MTVLVKDPAERTRFLKFAMVGMTGTVVDFAIMNTLGALAHTPLVISGTISFVIAVINNFVWNRFWTYPESRSKHLLGQLLQFALVNTIGLVLIRIPILTFGEPMLDQVLANFPQIKTMHTVISHNITLAIAIAIVMMWNFFVNRYWTYNDI